MTSLCKSVEEHVTSCNLQLYMLIENNRNNGHAYVRRYNMGSNVRKCHKISMGVFFSKTGRTF